MADQFDPAQVSIALRETWGLRRRGDDTGARLSLKLGPNEAIPPELTQRLWVAMGEGWVESHRWPEAAEPLAWGTPDPRMREALLNDLEAELEQAGIEGASAVQAYPTGWLWIAQVMTHHMAAWAAEGEEIAINDVKEKFGTLRCYAYGGDRVLDLARWCELQSETRCMATGLEGRPRNAGGWVLCLSDEMFERQKSDRDAVMNLIYARSSRI